MMFDAQSRYWFVVVEIVLLYCSSESLAYLTAATHGLEEEAEQLASSFAEGEKLPEVDPNAKLLQPPVPIAQQESNWPLLHVSKGFMERAMQGGGSKASAGAASMAVEDTGEDAGWGEEADLILDEGIVVNSGTSNYLAFILV